MYSLAGPGLTRSNFGVFSIVLKGVEIFSEDQAHMLLVFSSQKDRDKFYDLVLEQPGTYSHSQSRVWTGNES